MPNQIFPFDTPSNYTLSDSDKLQITLGEAILKLTNDPDNDFNEDFADDTGFIYDSDKAEFSGSQVQQKLVDITGQNFIEDFADDTDFVYDSDLAEFSGGQVQQTNKRPADAVFYVDFTDNSEDADWTDVGTGVGTLYNGATVHDGKLDLTGYASNRYLSINAYNTSHDSQKGCMRCLFTPNFSGNPTYDQYIMQWRDGGLENNIQVYITTSGFIRVWIRDGMGGTIVASTTNWGTVNFTAGQPYEIELNWDCDAGEHRLFINGIQQGSTQSGTGTRDGRIDQFDFGVYYNNLGQPNFSISKFIYFNNVQHTTDYTPDWSNIYAYDYVTSKVELPTMTYAGTQIKEFTGITSTESGSPKYVLDDKYWNGASWVSSDGSYSQANTLAEVNTNIGSLTPTGATLNIDVVFDNSSTQSSVDELQVNYTGSTYVETEVVLPEMAYTGAGTLIEVTNFVTSFSGSPRLTLEIGRSGDELYWNGSAWAVSDETYAQATDPATFATNAASLPVNGEIYGQFKIYFTDSVTQSAFSDLTITLTSQIYPTDNPYLDINSRWYLDELEAISAVKTVTGSDEIKLALKKGTQFYYISGGVLTASDGTYSQSNTVAEWETNKALYTSIKTYIGIRIFLHSADGSTTPSIDTLTVQYSYAGDTPDTVNKCIVWGTFLDELGDPMIGPIKVTLTDLVAQYKTGTMIRRKSPVQEMTLDSTGYGEIELVETDNMTGSQTYTFQFDNNVIRKRQVPDAATANFWDLPE